MTLEQEIRAALNRASAENQSNTPDYILARYLMECLAAYNRAVKSRTAWHHNDEILGKRERRRDG